MFAGYTGIFLLALLGTRFLIRFLASKGVMDMPNQRSSHQIPTPRGGGIVIVLTMTGLMAFLLVKGGAPFSWLCLTALLLIALINLLDDKLSLPVLFRLTVQLIAAGIIVYDAGPVRYLPLPAPLDIPVDSWGYPLSILWLLGLMNIYNFLDGIDGYAGTQTVIASIGIGLLFPEFQALCFGIAAATLGFLVFNWHPARIFMGDTGSATMGFFFAVLPFYSSTVHTHDAILTTGILLWFFVADGVFTIIRRLIKKEKIWLPHRSHLYQRLVIAGYQHHTVVLTIMGGSLVITTSYSIAHTGTISKWYILLQAILLFIGLVVWVTRAEKKAEQKASK